MARGYSVHVPQDQPPPESYPASLPLLWLLSDARNDADLERALKALPKGSGFIFRHYHLTPIERRARFRELAAIARKNGHKVILADTTAMAVNWGSDGVYGPAARLQRASGLLKLATAHDLKEIVAADRAGADAILLSPVFVTATHPNARPLGPVRFRTLARKTARPIIALGGMNPDTAKRLNWPRWAAIDGLY